MDYPVSNSPSLRAIGGTEVFLGKLLPILAALLTLPLFSASSHGATVYWSGDGTNRGGNGTWSTSGSNWSSSTTGPFNLTWNNSGNDTAYFGNTNSNPYTVTLGSNVTANILLQTTTTSPVTINPDAGNLYSLTIAGGSTVHLEGASANLFTINAPVILAISGTSADLRGHTMINGTISESGGSKAIQLYPTGVGPSQPNTFTLNGNNTFTGGVNLLPSFGIFAIGHDKAMGTGNFSWGNNATITAVNGDRIIANRVVNNWDHNYIVQGSNDITFTGEFKAMSYQLNQFSSVNVTNSDCIVTFQNFVIQKSGNDGEGFKKFGAGTMVIENSFTQLAGNHKFAVDGGTLIIAANSPGMTSMTIATGATLQIGKGGTTGNISISTPITNNGMFSVNRSDTVTQGTHFYNSIVGTGAVSQNGTGILVLNAANTYTGGTNINAGTLRMDHLEALGPSGTISFGGGTLLFGSGNSSDLSNRFATTAGQAFNIDTGTSSVTFSSAIASSGGTLTKNGSGTLVLSGSNAFTGATTINAGNLTVSGGSALSDSSSLTLANAAGAILHITSSETIGSLSGGGGSGGNVSISSSQTLTVNQTSATTFAGSISGAGGLTKSGSETLTLSGINSFTGAISIQSGNLTVTGGSALSDSNSLTLSNTAGAILHIASSETAGSLSGGGGSGGNISIASGQTFTLNQTSSGSFGGTITGSGALTKNGSATLTLSGSATHSGATTVNAGTLALSGANLLSSSANVTIAAPGTLQFLSGNQALGSIAGSGTIDLGSVTLTTGTFNSTFSGTISGLGGLTKSGAGTLTLNGTGDFFGQTNILGGTLVIANANALRSDSLVTLESGATLTLDQVTVVGSFENNGGTLNGSGSLVTALVLTESGTLAAVIADGTSPVYAAGVRKITSGTTTIDAANTYTGLTRIEGGTLVLGSSGSFSASSSLLTQSGATLDLANKSQTFSAVNGPGGTIALGSGTLTINASTASSTSAAITGSGGLVKNGSAALTLGGNSSFSGGTIINAGNLTLAHASAAGSGTITLSSASSTLTIDTTGTVSNSITASSISALQSATLSGPVTINATTFFVDSADTLTVSGTVGGAGGISKTGDGTLALSANNNFTGGTTLSSGTTRLDHANGLGSSGTLAFSGGWLQYGTGISNDLSARFATTASQAFNIDTGANTVTFATALQGTGSTLSKNGSGTLVLSASNSFTGTTSIQAGNLTLSGGTALPDAAAITLSDTAGAVLHIASSETIGSLTGGGSSGGNLSLASGQTLTVNQTSGATFAGAIVGPGAFTKNGSATLILSGVVSNSGGLAVNAGNLTLTGGSAAADNGPVVLSNTAGAILHIASSETIGSLSGGGASGGNISIVAGQTLTANQSSDATFAGSISGSGAFTKNGSATLVLSGVNSNSGILTINAGNLTLSGGFALADTAAVTLANNAGAVLHIASSETIGVLSGGGASGGNISIASGQTLTATQSSSATYAGAISGSGGLTKAGSETLTLSGANTYSGSTTINAGTLELTGGSSIADNSAVILANTAGVVLNVTANETIGSLSGAGATGGNITITASRFLTINQTTSGTFNGRITGTNGGLIKQGEGTLSLTRANSYSGATTINAGNLTLGVTDALSDSTNITLANTAGAVLHVAFNDTVGAISGGGTTGGNISIGAGTLTASSSSSTTFAGSILGAGNFTKAGSGTLTLSGANTLTGNISITGGNLTLTGGSALPDSGNLTLSNTAGVVLHIAASETIGNLLGGGATGGNVSIASGQTLTLNQTTSATFAGLVIGAGSLTKNGSGALTISAANTYTGTTTVNAGSLVLGADSVLSDSTAVVVNTGGTLSATSRSDTIASLAVSGGALTGSSATLTVSGVSSFTNSGSLGFSGAVSGRINTNGAVTLGNFTFFYNHTSSASDGNGLNLGANVAVSDSTTVNFTNNSSGNFGRIELNGNREFTVGTGANMNVNWVVDQFGGTRSLTKSGAGNLTLNAANTYAGGTNINAGLIQIGNADALGSSGTISFGGGTLQYGAGITADLSARFSTAASQIFNIDTGSNNVALATALTSSGATLTKNGTGTLTLSGANTYTGTTTINSGTLQIGAGGATGSLASTSLVNNSALLIDRTGSLTLASNISGSGTLTKNGSGTLVLAGSNSYNGATTLNLGTLTLQHANALGTGSFTQTNGSSLLTIDTTGTIANTMSLYNVSALQSATLNGTITVNNATFDVESGDTLTLSGGVGGTGGVTKNGTGTLILSGSNTYSGATIINAGTLNAANANALGTNASVTVNGGSLLVSADDAINGKNLTLNSSSTTTAGLVFSGTYNGTAGSLTLNQDSIIDLGTGSVVIHFTSIAGLQSYSLSIYNWTGTPYSDGGNGGGIDQFYSDGTNLSETELDRISFHSGGLGTNSFVGKGFQVLSGNYTKEIIPIPEPETYATALLLLLGLGLYLRHQRKPAPISAPRS